MEWKKFNESQIEYPEIIVEGMIEGFSNATQELVELIKYYPIKCVKGRKLF